MNPLLVGETNPYGDNPRMALYPLPPHASGGRLAKILGLLPYEYLNKFDRTNLCQGRWDLHKARETAAVLRLTTQPKILLGAKVCRAFGIEYYQFSEHRSPDDCGWLYILPHPSGLNRVWNEPAAVPMARHFLKEFLQ